MDDSPSPRRRFQFRLRTLMIGVTLLIERAEPMQRVEEATATSGLS